MCSQQRAPLAAIALGIVLAAPASIALAQDLGLPADEAAMPATEAAPAIAPPKARAHGRHPSGLDARLAWWVNVTGDNHALPFLIVDKLSARVFVFDTGGQLLGSAPVLVGLARGDDSAPGIGRLKLSEIGADERTTPAGRFVAAFGPSDRHGQMLWVDLPDAISLHPVMSVNPGEHRLQRIKSPDPNQHRISYGCINVPARFYDGVVLPALGGGEAVVYVLPDTKPVGAVFPAFAAALDEADGAPPRDEASAGPPAKEPVGKPALMASRPRQSPI